MELANKLFDSGLAIVTSLSQTGAGDESDERSSCDNDGVY